MRLQWDFLKGEIEVSKMVHLGILARILLTKALVGNIVNGLSYLKIRFFLDVNLGPAEADRWGERLMLRGGYNELVTGEKNQHRWALTLQGWRYR